VGKNRRDEITSGRPPTGKEEAGEEPEQEHRRRIQESMGYCEGDARDTNRRVRPDSLLPEAEERSSEEQLFDGCDR
jgi:hypothetical protein